MKRLIPLILASLLLSGCSIIPKTVEFFQKKVKPIPQKEESQKEFERQAASYINQKVDEAFIGAMQEDASTNIINPLTAAKTVAPALQTSLGPPAKPYVGNPTNLAAKINKEVHDLNKGIDKARAKQEPLVDKKIEGTGLIQIPYFVYVGGILLGIWLIIQIAKVASAFYPPVGIGLNAARIPAKALAKLASETIEGGEEFKKKLEKKIQDPATLEAVKEIFTQAHLEKQSRETQKIVRDLTQK